MQLCTNFVFVIFPLWGGLNLRGDFHCYFNVSLCEMQSIVFDVMVVLGKFWAQLWHKSKTSWKLSESEISFSEL